MSKRILYVCHRVPYPPDKGDRIRNYNILKYLSTLGDVDLLALADEHVTTETLSELAKYTRQFRYVRLGISRWVRALISLLKGRSITEGAFYSKKLVRILRQPTDRNYDVAIASSSGVAHYLQQIPETSGLKKIVDLIDIDSAKWQDYAEASAFPKNWIYHRESRAIAKLEDETCKWAAGIALVNDLETLAMQGRNPEASVFHLPNGVDLNYFSPEVHHEPRATFEVVFLGAMNYHPNVDAVLWFANNVWPAFYNKHPDASFTIVGRQPDPSVLSLAKTKDITVTGSVDDVRPHLRRADVIVSPLRIARGIQNKVLEGLAMGKASIVTPIANQGLSTVDGKHLLIAESREQWIDSLEMLHDRQELRQDLSQNGRTYVEAHHDWTACLSILESRI